MSYAGIDMDTHAVHVVRLAEDGSATYDRFELSGSDAFERTRSIRDALPARSAAFWDDVEACAIEEPQGAQRATVAKLKAVQGAVLACLPSSLLVEPLVPARWRTVCGLSGRASKEKVMDFVKKRAGVYTSDYAHPHFQAGTIVLNFSHESRTWPQDACDAYCLALAVSRLVQRAAA
jgi:hypothetical protein